MVLLESECAHFNYDIYFSYCPLHGLWLIIKRAEQLGKEEDVIRFKTLYNRLEKGILEHLTEEVPVYGKIW